MALIRQLRNDETEWQQFLRFLELSYGAPYNLFPGKYPHFYVRDEERLKIFWVVEDEGQIVAHVGLFPFEVHVGNVALPMGGIGGVATHPAHRGRGHMSRLLNHLIRQMDKRDWPVSVLWGLRTRYRPFGWEVAGTKYELTFTRRALGRLWDEALDVAEVAPQDAASHMAKLYTSGHVWVRRTDMPRQLRRAGLRVWLAPDGYACGERTGTGLSIHEAHSHNDNVPALIAGIMRRLRCDTATMCVGAEDRRLETLWESSGGWQTRVEGCFRINNSVRYLALLHPLLESRLAASGAADFSRIVRVTRDDSPEQFAVRYSAGTVDVSASNGTPDVAFEWETWVRILLGGPVEPHTRARLGPLGLVLPIPLHVPLLDHI